MQNAVKGVKSSLFATDMERLKLLSWFEQTNQDVKKKKKTQKLAKCPKWVIDTSKLTLEATILAVVFKLESRLPLPEEFQKGKILEILVRYF